MTRLAIVGVLLGSLGLMLGCVSPAEEKPQKLSEEQLAAVAETAQTAASGVSGVTSAKAYYSYRGPVGTLSLSVGVEADPEVGECAELVEEVGRAVVEAVASQPENPRVSISANLPRSGDQLDLQCTPKWEPANLDGAAAHYGIKRG